MNSTYYEVWVKDKPLTVQERAQDGITLSWHLMDEAIKRAEQLHKLYPNIDYVVRECAEKTTKIVYDTSVDRPAEP